MSCGLALCSLSYELIFTQVLGVLFGSQVAQYNLVISIFTSTLGIGALFFPFVQKRLGERRIFIINELSLFILGLCGPFFLVYLNSTFPNLFSKSISYFLVAIVGLLSGFELPLMFRLLKESAGAVLAFDYLGMVAATLLIPLWLFPELGVAASSVLISLCNLFLLIFIISTARKRIFSSLIILILIFATYCYKTELNLMMSTLYLRGNS